VVRIVALGRGAGKTLVGEALVRCLMARGFSVGVVKHASHGIALEEKDSKRYLEAGAEIVLVSTKGLSLLYRRGWIDDLDKAIMAVGRPIVVVEGFKEGKVGDVVAVVRSLDEIERLAMYENLVAVVGPREVFEKIDASSYKAGTKFLNIEDVDELCRVIIERALERTVSCLTAGMNCGMCGYSTCRALAEAYLRGLDVFCPRTIDVTLRVDGRVVILNPFVKRLLTSLLSGTIRSLKGVPEKWRELSLEIRLQ